MLTLMTAIKLIFPITPLANIYTHSGRYSHQCDVFSLAYSDTWSLEMWSCTYEKQCRSKNRNRSIGILATRWKWNTYHIVISYTFLPAPMYVNFCLICAVLEQNRSVCSLISTSVCPSENIQFNHYSPFRYHSRYDWMVYSWEIAVPEYVPNYFFVIVHLHEHKFSSSCEIMILSISFFVCTATTINDQKFF